VRPRSPIIPFIVAALAGAGPACGTLERVGRPPSAAEIALIDAAAADGRNMAVESTVDLAHYPVHQPSCAGGGCGAHVEPLTMCVDGRCEIAPNDAPRIKDPPRAIAFADAQQIVFATRLGGELVLPMNEVTGVKISGVNRPLGAAIGLGLGAVVDLAVGSAIYVGRRLAASGDGAAASPCTATCDAGIALALLPALVAGALIGHAVGVPQRFVFGDGATGR
jgi:hypothetical protein